MDSPWPFASVWRLVKDFAQINAGKDHCEYPIYSPPCPDPPQDQRTSHTRHKLLQALWSACFHVCESYVHCPAQELAQQPLLHELVANLCHQLRPEWESSLDGPSLPTLTASLKATSKAVTLLLGGDKSLCPTPEPTAGWNKSRQYPQALFTSSLHSQLDLVNNLWELRQERRAQYQAPHIHLPLRACEGDDLCFQREIQSDTRNAENLIAYSCYNRSYISQVESLLTSLHALFFHIITRSSQRPTSDIDPAENDLQQNVADVKLCWAVCESLQCLTYRPTETEEGWMIYELRRDIRAGLRLEKAYSPEGLTRWDPNPWGRISRPSRPIPELNQLVESERASNDVNFAIPLRPSLDVSQESHDGIPNPATVISGGVAVRGTSATSHPADPPPRHTTWASILTASVTARSVASEHPSCASGTARSAMDHGAVSVSGSDAGFTTACDCNCPALDPQDLDYLHHIRLRILLRTAAIQRGWHNGHNMSFRDYVRSMSLSSFGKSEKRIKLFMDYRNAVLNPQNNIKERGDIAAHQGTLAQIKRAVEWKTEGGKHQFLTDLFHAVTGKQLGLVDEGCDEVIVA
ncbi:hypothetical protein L211DRAFT_401118 [Terfezia boudieri ATCC MYA-4762]|uniref:DUF7624 domain-containing protein n=1 Tax=Terfezia boudieri ATCC MYA-4762 TaxID=1051890 RepID=A0A3N4M3T9_9PEZI|nr:hypothetical protein L211DRAFT_401118 [Terfezia boudieri ATCC MYA-4762]